MARKTIDNLAWHNDQLVRDIGSEVDDRPNHEIAESVMEVSYDRTIGEPKATKHLTKKQAVDAAVMASQIVDWANYGEAYNDYGNPPWERSGNPGGESTQYPGRPRGWKPADPWIAKLGQWMPSPIEVSKGSPFYGGGYWTVMRQGGLTSGGFRTKALATKWKASSTFKKHYASKVNPKRGKKVTKKRTKKATKKRISVGRLVARALK